MPHAIDNALRSLAVLAHLQRIEILVQAKAAFDDTP